MDWSNQIRPIFWSLELVEGETLAERIARGPVPVAEALEIARQVVDTGSNYFGKVIVRRAQAKSTYLVRGAAKSKWSTRTQSLQSIGRAIQTFPQKPTLLKHVSVLALGKIGALMTTFFFSYLPSTENPSRTFPGIPFWT
jgi:hypothetical protein